MSKLKNPLLSFGAKGTLGSALTFQETPPGPLVRTKPLPAYRRTLLQQYQRWDYEDAIYYWETLSTAQKSVYRATASRLHLPIFAAFMRYYLRNLPDIEARYRLDEVHGTVAYDSSKQNLNGVRIGAQPTSGFIGGAYKFDGLDDTVKLGATLFDTLTDGTVEILIKANNPALNSSIISHRKDDSNRLLIFHAGNKWYVYHRAGATTAFFTATLPATRDITHLLMTFGSTGCLFYVDGLYQINSLPGITIGFVDMGVSLYNEIGSRVNGIVQNLKGVLDNYIVWNRILTQEQIRLHSERRYP